MSTTPLQTSTAPDPALHGGKGANLIRLTQEHFPVPPGFVIGADIYREFVTATGIDIEIAALWHQLDPEGVGSLNEASHRIRGLFAEAPLPQETADTIMTEFETLGHSSVAVRSSAQGEDASRQSWAGELETFLNCARETLLDHVRQCWSSLFTPRALAYRYHHELHGNDIAVAVVVQAMIDADVAGVCFTQHPVTRDPDEMVIEAIWGLGEPLTAGTITPDRYIYDRKEQLLLSSTPVKQITMAVMAEDGGVEMVTVPLYEQRIPTLSEYHVRQLANLAVAIEQKMKNVPQDIEWALDGDTFFVLQSRPIV